jgi:FKBP-type peptidyl-prolyl cis-trans isomerase SlyD
LTKDSEKQNGLAVADGLVVSLAYSLRLDDGEEIDSAASDEPLVYLHGARNIIPGLEQALTGLKIGDARQVSVIPVDAYGDFDPDAFELVPYDSFPADVDLEEGMGLRMVDNSTGRHVEAQISELRDDGALLDLNHPLAGETLHFNVEIVGLRRATTDEIAHGHVHGAGHTH